jgi:hypothetical protein
MTLKVSEIDKAIGSHGVWKGRIRTLIESGKTDIPVETAALTDACDFGKWLSDPKLSARDKASAHYARVNELHTRFHKVAAAAIELALAGKKAEAEKMIAGNGALTALSAELTTAMLEWRKSLSLRKK